MTLYELVVNRRDSSASQQTIGSNEKGTQFLDRKQSFGGDSNLKVKVDGSDHQPEGGWGWMVTFGAFVINVIVDGIIYTFGLFFIELYQYYDESKSLTAWIGSVSVGVCLLSGNLSSVLITLFGSRVVAISGGVLSTVGFFLSTFSPNVPIMILLYGVIGGLGLGLMYLTCIVTVGYYFTRRRALATGIAMAGSGVGAISFAPLMEYLINLYSWKGAMWIVSGICLNGVAMGALFRPVNQSDDKKSKQQESRKCCGNNKDDKVTSSPRNACDWSSLFEFSLLKRLSFLLYNISSGICLLSFFVPVTFLPDHAKNLGLTSEHSVILISVMSVATSVSRVFIGWVADQSWSNSSLIRSIICIIVGVATGCVPYYKSFELLIVYSIVIGGTIGVYMALLSIITIDLVGIEKLSQAFGLVTMFMGIATMVASPIGGALADASGDYNISFYYAGGMLTLAGVMTLPIHKLSQWERSKNLSLPDIGVQKLKIEEATVHCISYNNSLGR